jgi:hypothetical protein
VGPWVYSLFESVCFPNGPSYPCAVRVSPYDSLELASLGFVMCHWHMNPIWQPLLNWGGLTWLADDTILTLIMSIFLQSLFFWGQVELHYSKLKCL